MLGWLLLSLLLACLLALLANRLSGLRRPKRDAVLLFGPSGSGKTALFAQLRAATATALAPTVTSLTPNVAPITFSPPSGVAVTRILVDLPGHPRLRGLFHGFAPRAAALIFLVDGREGTFLPSARATAELLWDALSHAGVAAPHVLLAVNKTDREAACHSPAFVRKHLEKEVGLLRAARGTLGEAGAAPPVAAPSAAAFSFEAAGVRLQAAGVSVLRRDLAAVHAFVASVV